MSMFDKVMWLKRQRKIINVLQKDKLNGERVYFYSVYIYCTYHRAFGVVLFGDCKCVCVHSFGSA